MVEGFCSFHPEQRLRKFKKKFYGCPVCEAEAIYARELNERAEFVRQKKVLDDIKNWTPTETAVVL